jgi:hypothetical protein
VSVRLLTFSSVVRCTSDRRRLAFWSVVVGWFLTGADGAALDGTPGISDHRTALAHRLPADSQNLPHAHLRAERSRRQVPVLVFLEVREIELRANSDRLAHAAVCSQTTEKGQKGQWRDHWCQHCVFPPLQAFVLERSSANTRNESPFSRCLDS